MSWLAIGVLAALGMLVFGGPRRQDPAARTLSAVFGGALILSGLALLMRGGIATAAPMILFGAVMLGGDRLRAIFGLPTAREPAWRGQGGVTTRSVHVTLDKEGQPIDGYVQRGKFSGKRLSDLSKDDLADFWGECELSDPEAAKLIGAYVARANRGPGGGGVRDKNMTLDEAREVLGVAPGASADDIRAAHKRLIRSVHPDAEGTDYLAAKVNAAKDMLLKDLN
ncbi:MAG: hypothetical protein AAGC95_06125 [Pseudomonadota bacterium]